MATPMVAPSTGPITLLDPPRDTAAINAQDLSLQFPHFTAEDAWAVGSLLRARLLAYPNPAVVNIALANSNQVLFHAVTHSGTVPDNDNWVSRKRKTVLRWGNSSWSMHNKFAGDEVAFAAKYMLGGTAGEYAIHGGGWPVRVRGVEGVIAVIVVSGLKQQEDHQMVVQTVQDYLESIGAVAEGEKKKED